MIIAGSPLLPPHHPANRPQQPRGHHQPHPLQGAQPDVAHPGCPVHYLLAPCLHLQPHHGQAWPVGARHCTQSRRKHCGQDQGLYPHPGPTQPAPHQSQGEGVHKEEGGCLVGPSGADEAQQPYTVSCNPASCQPADSSKSSSQAADSSTASSHPASRQQQTYQPASGPQSG